MRVARKTVKAEDLSPKKEDLSLLNPLIEKYRNLKGNIIPLLQGTQDIFGYIPEDAFELFNQKLGLNISNMYGVATFYSQFRLSPVGKHIIKVCHGTACHVLNAPKLTEALEDSLKIKDGETTDDGLFTLESVACLGCCSLAPVIMVGDETYGKLDGKKAVKIIRNIKLSENN
jgi:NADH-quinone oxidoreductase subunit E